MLFCFVDANKNVIGMAQSERTSSAPLSTTQLRDEWRSQHDEDQLIENVKAFPCIQMDQSIGRGNTAILLVLFDMKITKQLS